MLYNAFLSYSHAADGRLAPALQTGLQQFAKPWSRLRAIRVFRDKTGLSATPGLWTAIEAALDSSEYFVLLASPTAAQSRWVQKEVEHWLAHRPANTILVTLTDGEIAWDTEANDFDWEVTNALPPVLRGKFAEELRWLDMRWAKKDEQLFLRNPLFHEVIAELSSSLRGIPKDELTGEDVRQHRKAVRLRRGAVAGLALLSSALALAAFIAVGQKTLAQRNAELASRNEQTANENAERARTNADLARENEEAAKKNEQTALENAKRAEKNRRQAEDNLKLAQQNERRAQENQRRAEENATEARRQAERALARQLAAQSEFIRTRREELPRATLLAVEAVRRYPSAETDQALRSAMEILPRPRRTLNLGGPVNRAIFNRQAHRLLVESNAAVGVRDLSTGRLTASFPTPNGLSSMAFSRDGSRVALAEHCTVTVYDAGSGRRLASMKPDSRCYAFELLDFSPDGKLLAGVGEAPTIVWNVVTGSVQTLEEYTGSVVRRSSVKFSPDGRHLASMFGGVVTVWSVPGWEVTRLTSDLPRKGVTALAFSEEFYNENVGHYLAAAAGEGAVFWSARDGKFQGAMDLPGGEFTGKVALAIDRDGLIAAAADNEARFWKARDGLLTSGREIGRIVHQGPILSITLSPDSRQVLTLSEDKTVGLWWTGGGEVARLVHQAPLRAAAFSADGGVWTVDASGQARAWDVPDLSQLDVAAGVPLNISADSRLLAVPDSLRRGLIEVWERHESDPDHTGREMKGRYLAVWSGSRQYLAARQEPQGVIVEDLNGSGRVLFLHNAEIGLSADETSDSINRGRSGAFFSGDGHYLSIRGLGTWEVATGRRLRLMSEEETLSVSVFSPNGRRAAAVRADGSIGVFELPSGRLLVRLPALNWENSSNAMAFSPNGRYLAKLYSPVYVWDTHAPSSRAEVFRNKKYGVRAGGFTSDSTYFVLHNLHDYKTTHVLNLVARSTAELTHESSAWVALSPKEPLIAIAWENSVRLWDARSGRDVGRLSHFKVSCITFSTDGKYLAAGGKDGRLLVWETATRSEVARLQYGEAVSHILFTPDNQHVVAGLSWNMSVITRLRPVWQEACARLGRPMTQDEWNQYLKGEPYRMTCPDLMRRMR